MEEFIEEVEEITEPEPEQEPETEPETDVPEDTYQESSDNTEQSEDDPEETLEDMEENIEDTEETSESVSGNSLGEDDSYQEYITSGENLEILQDIYAELELMKESEKEYRLLTEEYRSEMLELQTAESGCSIIICVALFIIAAEIPFREIFSRLK